MPFVVGLAPYERDAVVMPHPHPPLSAREEGDHDGTLRPDRLGQAQPLTALQDVKVPLPAPAGRVLVGHSPRRDLSVFSPEPC